MLIVMMTSDTSACINELRSNPKLIQIVLFPHRVLLEHLEELSQGRLWQALDLVIASENRPRSIAKIAVFLRLLIFLSLVDHAVQSESRLLVDDGSLVIVFA